MKIFSSVFPNWLLKIALFILYVVVLFTLFPLSSAVFFAYLIFPVVFFVHRKLHIPYFLSILLVGSFFLSILFLLGVMAIQSLLHLLPTMQGFLTSLPTDYEGHPLFPFLLDKLSTLSDSILTATGSFLRGALNSLFELVLFFLTVYFSLLESKKNRLWFFALVPKIYRTDWQRYFTKTMELFSYFFLVEFQLFVLTFLLLCGGFSFLQFDGAINKAFLIALADCIPFLGIGLFLVPAALYFFFIGNWLLATSLLVLYIFVQITRQLAESKLWAHTMQLRMAHTFLISAAAFLLFGIYGILLSPLLLFIAVKLKDQPIFAR